MTTQEHIDKLKKLCDAATEGPWRAYDWPEFPKGKSIRIENKNEIVAFCFSEPLSEEALLICESRTALPKLIECLELAEFMLCEVIRNSPDIVAKKKCSEIRVEINSILERE